jgi:hypothetical protein
MPIPPHCTYIFLSVISLNVQTAYASLSVSTGDTNMMSHNQTAHPQIIPLCNLLNID